MKKIRQASRVLFEADDPLNLAIARVLVFLGIAKSVEPGTIAAFAELPTDLMVPPLGMGTLFPALPLDSSWVFAAGWILRGLALAAAAGLATRGTTLITVVGAWVYLGIPSLFGHVAHTLHHLIWFGSILALSPCGDTFSIDALLGRRSAGPPSPRYGFPLRCMWLLLGIAFFFAGFWKIGQSGLAWFWSDGLSHLSAKRIHATGGSELTWLTGWLTQVGGLLTIVFELAFPLAVFSRRGRSALFVIGLLFHGAVFVTLKISFSALMLTYPILLDNASILRWLRAKTTGTPAPAAPADSSADPSRALVALSIFWIVGLTLTGALRIGSAWPVSAFPRFERIHTPFFTSYVLRGRLPDDSRVEVRDSRIGSSAYRHHLYRLIRLSSSRAIGLDTRDDLMNRWQVLCTLAWASDPRLRLAKSVEFVLVDLDLSDGPAHPVVLDERVAFSCSPPT